MKNFFSVQLNRVSSSVSVEVDNPTSSFSAPLPQLAQSSTKTRERLIPKGGSWAGLLEVGNGVGGNCPAAPVWLGYLRSSGVGLELKGLGFIVPVLLPGTTCLSAPSQLLRGRLGGALKERAEMNVLQWNPELGCWTGCAAAGRWVLAPL